MPIGWNRLEAMARDVALTEGLQAPLADPLWLLSRQWQVGEFNGDDAAMPAVIRISRHTYPLTRLSGGISGDAVFPHARPLEAAVENIPAAGLGSAGLYDGTRAAYRLITDLRAAGLGAAVDALRSAYPLTATTDAGVRAQATVDLLTRWGIDTAALAGAADTEIADALAAKLNPADVQPAVDVVTAWQDDFAGRAAAPVGCWDSERLRYAFTVTADVDGGRLVLAAPDHDGGHLDWHTFDVAEQPERTRPGKPVTTVGVPAPVRYPGLPADRWWEIEDAAVSVAGFDAGPADLARMLVAEFALIYGGDWFVVPIRVPAASVTEIVKVEVFDTTGGRTPLLSTAMLDGPRGGVPRDLPDVPAGPSRTAPPRAERAWRFFELGGDEVGPAHPSPWLLVASSVASGQDGPPLERVTLTRDEAVNLAWGVEHEIEGPLGRGMRRAETFTDTTGPALSPAAPGAWRYRLEAPAPPWWIPLQPERLAGETAQMRLRRSRIQSWELLDGEPAGPRGELLDPRAPRWIAEEEVPSGGVELRRTWQYARWVDGSAHAWRQWRKHPGRPMPGSGLRWDLTE